MSYKVRSKPLGEPSEQRHVFSRAALERTRGPVERLSAWMVLFASLLGSVVACHGSWNALIDTPSIGRTALGITLQLGLTYVQWAYSTRLGLAWSSRAIDAGLTAAGYGPLVHGAIAAWFVANGASSEPLLIGLGPWSWAECSAWVLIWVVSLLPAWYPESRLVG